MLATPAGWTTWQSRFTKESDVIELNGASHGEEQPPCVLGISWDEKTQTTQLLFDSKEYKTWNFILAVLAMARQDAEHNLKLQQMANLQKAAAQQQQDQIIAQQVKRSLRG